MFFFSFFFFFKLKTQMRIRDHFGLNDAANSSAHDDAFSADPEDSSSVALTLSSKGKPYQQSV